MLALIDNYTTQEIAKPKMVNVEFLVQEDRRYSSAITLSANDVQINARILRMLQEFSKLEDNWDGDDALAPAGKAVLFAYFVAKVLGSHGQLISHAAPGPNGEVMLDIRNRRKTRSLELIFYPNRSVAVMFPEQGQPSQQSFDFANLPELMEWVNRS